MKEKYDLLEEIRKELFGVIYKSKLKNTDEMRAIKIIPKTTFVNNLGREYAHEAFLSNLENMTICCQNNINSVKLYEYFNTENELGYVMELVDEDLGQFLKKRNQGLNPQEILEILKQLNNIFKIMVNNLIVHRDLKLENIFIKYKNNEKTEYIIKLGNYGLSTRLNSINQKIHQKAGTPQYIAPEIIKGENYDGKCDLWSLGFIIYFLLFKEFPIKKEGYKFALNFDKFDQKSLKESGNELLDDLIKKLLEKDPGKRISWEQYFEHAFFK